MPVVSAIGMVWLTEPSPVLPNPPGGTRLSLA
jgi:hypothetical protein